MHTTRRLDAEIIDPRCCDEFASQLSTNDTPHYNPDHIGMPGGVNQLIQKGPPERFTKIEAW